jgi:hypothetical protein
MYIIIKKKLKTLSLAFLYFFLSGFLTIFLMNLLLRELVWAFFSDSGLLISLANLVFSLLALYLGIHFLTPHFHGLLELGESRLFFAVSQLIMIASLALASYLVLPGANNYAKVLQLFNALVIAATFAYLSQKYLKKHSAQAYE